MTKKIVQALVEKIDERLFAVASTEVMDRVGDIVKVDGWDLKNFKKNPVLLFAHNYHEAPIGYAKDIRIENKKLIFEPVFHSITQLAREVKEMFFADPAIMRAFSVGFIPTKFNDEDSHIIEKQELLEISAVPVPANADALALTAKSVNVEERKEITSWLKKEEEPVEEKEEEEISTETPEEPKEEPKEETPEEKPEEKPEETPAEIIEKAGRVLSENNREKIKSAVESLKTTIFALKELLLMSEPSSVSEENKSVKGRKEEAQGSRKNRIIVRALQKISKDINKTLRNVKKEKDS